MTLPKGYGSFSDRNPEISLIIIGFIFIGFSVLAYMYPHHEPHARSGMLYEIAKLFPISGLHLSIIWISISMIPFGLVIYSYLKTGRLYTPPPKGYKPARKSWKKMLLEGWLATTYLKFQFVLLIGILIYLVGLVIWDQFFR